MRLRLLCCCVLGLTASAMLPAATMAGETFVPKGHSYSPDQAQLPSLNSDQDRINSQADIYEAEIYRIQRERAILQGELTRHSQHDLTFGAEFSPRY